MDFVSTGGSITFQNLFAFSISSLTLDVAKNKTELSAMLFVVVIGVNLSCHSKAG